MDTDVDGSQAGPANRSRLRPVVTLMLACATAAGLMVGIFAGALPPVSGLLAVTLVVTTVFWHLRAHLPSLLLVFFTVLLATVVAGHRWPKFRGGVEAHQADSLSRAWATSGPFDRDLPIVLHLVFDEMMSPGAITDDLPGGYEVRQLLQAFGAKHGFRMFDSVYSRSFFSGESLPNMMNPEYLGRTRLTDVFTEQQTEHPSNAYFDDLAGRGYRTAVFQTALMDFCANRQVDMCQTFDSFDPRGDNEDTADLRNRTPALWQALLRAYEPSYVSEIGQTLLSRKYGLGTRRVGVLGVEGRYDVQRFPEWFDRFTAFAATVPRGTHLFAHFMVPHSPYLLTEECVVSGRFEAGYYLTQYPAAERPERRQQYYKAYLAQLHCLAQKLDELMLALGQSENYRDAVIVIHGDHGSRISSGNILEDYSERDFVDNYGTFFAVRSPGVPAGVDCQFVSLPEVFRRHVATGPARTSPGGAPLPVVVISRAARNAKVEAAMPSFGCHNDPGWPIQ